MSGPVDDIEEIETDDGAEVVAGSGQGGERLDRFLAAMFPALSRSRLKILIEKGRVTRDGALVTDPSAKVIEGARYAVLIPPPEPAEPEPEDIPLTILYEDVHVLVIDKPAGLSVHPAPGNWTGTLVNAVLHHCGADLRRVGATGRPGIVHRLDMDTSGVMVVAKSDFALASLGRQFQDRTVARSYTAFSVGFPRAPWGMTGRIEARLGRDPNNRKRMAVLPPHATAGKTAATHYEVTQKFGSGVPRAGAAAGTPMATRLRCVLETGRTHQVRVHMAHVGAPLIGDQVYGQTRAQRKLLELLPESAQLERQALHAATLAFTHPDTGARLTFDSALPADLQTLEASLAALP